MWKWPSHSPFRQALTMFGYAAISNFCPAFFNLTTEIFVRICGMQGGGAVQELESCNRDTSRSSASIIHCMRQNVFAPRRWIGGVRTFWPMGCVMGIFDSSRGDSEHLAMRLYF
jgi:hypothetical protein